MKHLESMDEVIECARAQLEPGAGDRTRIKRALVAQVMGLSAVGTSAVSKGAVATAAAGGLSTTPTIVGLVKVFASSVLVTAAGATAILATSEALDPAPSAAQVVMPSVAPPTARRTPSQPQATPEAPAPPALTASSVPAHRPTLAPAPQRQARGVSAPAAVDPLNAELGLLQRVRALTATGRASEARALLNELDQKHPGGVLVEERMALAALLSCQQRTGTRAAEVFLARYPSSLYVSRIRQACDSAPAPAAPFIDPSASGH